MPGPVPGLFSIEESMENQATAIVENPYGPAAMWAQGDFVTRGTLIILAVMSLFSWYIMLTKIWDQRKLRMSARVVDKGFWNAPTVKEGVERLKKGDDFRNIAEDGLRAASHHDGRLTDRIDLHRVDHPSLQRSVEW
jgi:biopolymer transport protein ExbB